MSRDALVVGINTYQYLPSLKAPARDAEAIAQQIHTHGEFRVHRLPEVIQAGQPLIGQKTQVTLRELETALIKLFKPKGKSVPQTALFYFSGHGIQREAGIQEGYLALSDSNPDKGFYGLSLFWLRRLLQESPVQQRIIWLDCCHSGELLNFLEADPGAHPGKDRLFMAASREYETAYESLDSPYSVFTDALLTGLDPGRVASGIVTNHSLTDWVNHTLKGEIQQPLFESSGSEIILTRCEQSRGRSGSPATASLAPAEASIQSSDLCPYRGLEFFDEAHAEYFFGREDLTIQLIKTITDHPFVVVTGASGSGKTSLVRAGLIAQLRQGKKRPGSEHWKIRLITPTEHPLRSLAAAFIDPELDDLERAEQLRRADTFLQEGGAGLAQLVRASLPASSNRLTPDHRPQFLLVVDQFEEVFTLSEGAHAERERQEFFDCLIGAMAIAKDLLSIVIVLRVDFFNQCSLYEGLAQLISQHQVMIPPLTYEQTKATIVRPAQKVGLVCEPNLVYTMLLDVVGAPGELPLLQYTLSELWRRRVSAEGGVARLTLDAYQELGGVRGTLQKRATEVFHQLTAAEQGVAKRIFLALTQLGEGTEDTRRRVVKSELVSPAFSITLVEQVLEKLVAAKLVIISQENQSIEDYETLDQDRSPSINADLAIRPCSEVVDVTHEALIRHWPLLRTWLNESREMLRRQRRIEQAAQEWQRAGKPTAGEFLLHGLRLRDAEDFLKLYPQELSALAQTFIRISCAECHRARRESRQLQIAIPSILVTTLAIVLSQYYGAVRTQIEKEEQIQKATSREWSAIAQTILQDSSADPMTALLIGRLAAEGKPANHEVQSSLRAALQNLRLQLELEGHRGAVRQIVFSPDGRYLSTAGTDGTIRLWEMNDKTLDRTSQRAEKVLVWSEVNQSTPAQVAIQSIAFSPSGQHLAASATNSSTVKLWSIESGAILHELNGPTVVQQVSFSPNGQWIAVLGKDQSISVWEAKTGILKAFVPAKANIRNFQFSPDGQLLLTRGESSIVQLWQLTTVPAGVVKLTLIKGLVHPEVVDQAIFSPSGRWIATLCRDGKVRLWSRQTGQLQRLFSNPGRNTLSQDFTVQTPETAEQTVVPLMQQLEFSPDEQTLATLNADGQVWLWHRETGRLQNQLNLQNKLNANGLPRRSQSASSSSPTLMRFSPKGQMLVTTTSMATAKDGFYKAYLWNRQTGQRVGALSGHRQPITSVQFNPDGTSIVTGSQDGTIRVWAAALGGELPSIQLAESPVEQIAFLSNRLVKQPHDVVETATSKVPSVHSQSSGWTKNVETETHSKTHSNPTASSLVAITADGQLQQWSILTDPPAQPGETQDIASATRHTAAIQPQYNVANLWKRLTVLASSPWQPPDHRLVQPAMAGFTLVTKILVTKIQFVASLVTPSTAAHFPNKLAATNKDAALSGIAISPDGQVLATADITGWVSVYRVQPDQSLQLLYRIRNWRSSHDKTDRLSEVARSMTTSQITLKAGQSDQAAQETAKPIVPVAIRHLTFSPDGQQLLGIADDLTMRSWRIPSGEQLAVFRGHEATIRQARYSADGQWIISASWDRTARIWQASTGNLSQVLPHQDAVSSASFGPDGQQVVTTSWNGTAQIWQVHSKKLLFLLDKHEAAVLDGQFSPDGTLLVTASTDGTARLWNTATGEEQGILHPIPKDEQSAILQAFFSPDGQYVATLTNGGQVDFWAATQEKLLQIAQNRTLRQLTSEECSHYLRLATEQCPRFPTSSN